MKYWNAIDDRVKSLIIIQGSLVVLGVIGLIVLLINI